MATDNKQVTVYLKPADYKMLRKMAADKAQSLARIVREIVAEWVRRKS